MSKQRVIVDPGHGGKDPGATYGDYQEKVWTLEISLLMVEELLRAGYQAILTRSEDIDLVPAARAKMVRESGAALCISNHINAGGGQGAEVIYSIKRGSLLPDLILNELVQAGMKRRRVYTKESTVYPGKDYFFMLRDTVPVETVIVEYGFLDHQADREKLRLPDQRLKLARASVQGALNYLERLEEQSSGNAEEGSSAEAVIVVTPNGVRHLFPESKRRLFDGRWYLEARTLTELAGGKIHWDEQKKQAIFDLRRPDKQK